MATLRDIVLCSLLIVIYLFQSTITETTSQCNIEASLLWRYWTYDNILKPDGCIDRSNVSLSQIDHGGIFSTFFYLPRSGAERACYNYGGMDCDITTTEQYDLTSMADLITSIKHNKNIYGLSVTLPTTEFEDELQILSNEGINIYSWNSGIDEFHKLHSKLHVGQNEYIAGYKGCLRLKDIYGATKILVIDDEHGTNIGLVSRTRGCQDAMDNNTQTLYVHQTNLQISVEMIANILMNDTQIDGILALSQYGEEQAHYVLTTYGLRKDRVSNITAIATFDYNEDILHHVLDELSVTQFIIDQQSYLQGYLPLYLMGIEATTSNHLIEATKIISGPRFIESEEDISLLHCMTKDVFYCHDDDDDDEDLSKMPLECQCIDSLSKTIYLFHHGSYKYVGSSLSDFYSILVSGAQRAADDINVSLKINTFETNTNILDLDGYSQFMEDIINSNIDDIDGIITTIPNQRIGDILLKDILSGIEIIGIADGYDIYKKLNFNLTKSIHPMYIGMDDEYAGYNISDLIHIKAMTMNMNIYQNDTMRRRVILCLNDEFGILSSLNSRCKGVERYCNENGLIYLAINTDSSNVDGSLSLIHAQYAELLSNNIIIEGIIGSGESSCLSAKYFIENLTEQQYDIILGCFDSSQMALDGLLSSSIHFIFDQQPFLIGYISMIMMTNKILINNIPYQLLIETGPKIIRIEDKEIIYTKECENQYKGYIFCPQLHDDEENKNENNVKLNEMEIMIIIIAGGCILIFCFILFLYYFVCHINKHNEYITNGLVVIIAIGEYGNIDNNNNNIMINGAVLRDLAIDKDIDHLNQVFAAFNYKILPYKFKMYWTESEIIDFLKNDVCRELFDADNELKYDALIVCVSCHGIENKIITSDYRTIEKSVIHRIISINHPKTREIPRIFLFDSCNGSPSKLSLKPSIENVSSYILNIDENKDEYDDDDDDNDNDEDEDDIKGIIELSQISNSTEWLHNTKNPDYKLVHIDAANIGFEAKCSSKNGSYLIYEFTKKLHKIINGGKNKTISIIFEEIQNKLHDLGKQQTINIFNNGTGQLQFIKNNQFKNDKQDSSVIFDHWNRITKHVTINKLELS